MRWLNYCYHKFVDWALFQLGVMSPSRMSFDLEYRNRVLSSGRFGVDHESWNIFLEEHNRAVLRLHADFFDIDFDIDGEEESEVNS